MRNDHGRESSKTIVRSPEDVFVVIIYFPGRFVKIGESSSNGRNDLPPESTSIVLQKFGAHFAMSVSGFESTVIEISRQVSIVMFVSVRFEISIFGAFGTTSVSSCIESTISFAVFVGAGLFTKKY